MLSDDEFWAVIARFDWTQTRAHAKAMSFDEVDPDEGDACLSADDFLCGRYDFERVTAVSIERFSNPAGLAPTEATRAGRYTGPDVPPGNRRP